METMRYGAPDRVPYFEEGIRKNVLRTWHRQGLPKGTDLLSMFPFDRREEIVLDLEPRPNFRKWPSSHAELAEMHRRLDPNTRGRLPRGWSGRVRAWQKREHVLMLRIHRGFFLTMGVSDWHRFMELMDLVIDDPGFVRQAMMIQGEFAASLAEKVLREVEVDAVLFSEPIGGNDNPLISPQMYEDLVLRCYEPIIEVLKRHGVETIVLVTYANFRILLPSILRWGFNCLWACEVNIEAMGRQLGMKLRRKYRHLWQTAAMCLLPMVGFALMCLLKTMSIIVSYYIKLRRKPIMVPEKSPWSKYFPGFSNARKLTPFQKGFD